MKWQHNPKTVQIQMISKYGENAPSTMERPGGRDDLAPEEDLVSEKHSTSSAN